MCGIAGLWGDRAESNVLEARTRAMTDAIHYRGPDSEGHWVDAEVGVALGHRRLAIVDLSRNGHQPMISACGRMVISYNGEIYNREELCAQLGRATDSFRGTSDTEVLLEACVAWGVERAVQACIGMFVFALWDRETRELYLVRDRLGIKPLYYGRLDGTFYFGSELKPLLLGGAKRPPLDESAIHSFMRHGYIPAPHTIFLGVHKLEPGHCLVIDSHGNEKLSAFWSLGSVIQQIGQPITDKPDDVWLDELETIIGDAVSRRMVADVPLGAFLSGGTDSSVVVAMMQKHSERAVRTFSIGFSEAEYNEAVHAKAVAKHLGTDHTELYVSPMDALEVIPTLADMYDEPFADSSQIPTFLVSKLTRDHVTVSLSGDGGDELFAGYPRYLVGDRLIGNIEKCPRWFRGRLADGIRRVSVSRWDQVGKLVPARYRPARVGDRAHKFADVLVAGRSDVYRRLVSLWQAPAEVVAANEERRQGVLWDPERPPWLADDLSWMQYADTITYLPDDILTKVDRASMAVSLEARVPLLDHRVVQLAWSMPRHLKVRGGKGKWALREVLYRHVPPKLIDRPKMGFGVPIDGWLRTSLREWAESLLCRDAIVRSGVLDAAVVERYWNEHLTGSRNWHSLLWNVLIFQAWYFRWANDG